MPRKGFRACPPTCLSGGSVCTGDTRPWGTIDARPAGPAANRASQHGVPVVHHEVDVHDRNPGVKTQ